METTIFLDMDGVLANFSKAAFEIHGKEWFPGAAKHREFYEDWGITEKEFWKPISNEEFWATLELLPKAHVLYELCQQLSDKVIFSTSPCMSPWCCSGKLIWLGSFLGRDPYPSEYFLGSSKQYLAAPGRWLIDDSRTNVEKFQKAGGKAILWPSAQNRCVHDLDDTFKIIKESLSE